MAVTLSLVFSPVVFTQSTWYGSLWHTLGGKVREGLKGCQRIQKGGSNGRGSRRKSLRKHGRLGLDSVSCLHCPQPCGLFILLSLYSQGPETLSRTSGVVNGLRLDRQLSGGTPGPDHSGSGGLYVEAFAAFLSWAVRSPEHWQRPVPPSMSRCHSGWYSWGTAVRRWSPQPKCTAYLPRSHLHKGRGQT